MTASHNDNQEQVTLKQPPWTLSRHEPAALWQKHLHSSASFYPLISPCPRSVSLPCPDLFSIPVTLFLSSSTLCSQSYYSLCVLHCLELYFNWRVLSVLHSHTDVWDTADILMYNQLYGIISLRVLKQISTRLIASHVHTVIFIEQKLFYSKVTFLTKQAEVLKLCIYFKKKSKHLVNY